MIWEGAEEFSGYGDFLCCLKRSQRKVASVNQHEIEKDFIKHKCVKLLIPNKSLHFSPLLLPALANRRKASDGVTLRFASWTEHSMV